MAVSLKSEDTSSIALGYFFVKKHKQALSNLLMSLIRNVDKEYQNIIKNILIYKQNIKKIRYF